MRDLTKAILSLYPEAKWTLSGNDYSGLEWFDSNEKPKPTQEELEAEADRISNEFDAKEYQRLRQPEYPSIGDQLDALFHAGVFPPEMAAQIQAIKDKYPKGS